jgi:hypothetical protein
VKQATRRPAGGKVREMGVFATPGIWPKVGSACPKPGRPRLGCVRRRFGGKGLVPRIGFGPGAASRAAHNAYGGAWGG